MNTLQYVILMKLLFGFCLDFCCQKFWITQASNLEITKKNYGNTASGYYQFQFDASILNLKPRLYQNDSTLNFQYELYCIKIMECWHKLKKSLNQWQH